MRPLLIGLVAIIATFAGATACLAARHREMKTLIHYDGCLCHFGYGIAGCAPDVACTSEGGQCAEACFVPNGQDYLSDPGVSVMYSRPKAPSVKSSSLGLLTRV
jgi:hypothetical protein